MPDGYDDEAREALLAKAAQAWEHDPALDPQALGDGSGEDGVLCYLRAYYQRVATEIPVLKGAEQFGLRL